MRYHGAVMAHGGMAMTTAIDSQEHGRGTPWPLIPTNYHGASWQWYGGAMDIRGNALGYHGMLYHSIPWTPPSYCPRIAQRIGSKSHVKNPRCHHSNHGISMEII